MDGYFQRMNGEMIESGQGAGSLISVIGSMEACDGQVLNLKACDGKLLVYNISADFQFEHGKIVEIMGTLNPDSGSLDAFVARGMGQDFDMELYNDMITKIANPKSKFGKTYFIPGEMKEQEQ